jgi:hypothetical protein
MNINFPDGTVGLTKTIETVELTKNQFRQPMPIPHLRSTSGQIMNDGCGRLSRDLAEAIRDKLELLDLPSAFQARIGGAQGLWLVDIRKNAPTGTWIEVYESQEKWHRDESTSFDDPAHRIFEVLRISTPCKPANLNEQFIPVLESGERRPGVMRDVISSLLERGLRREYDQLNAALDDPWLLRAWVQSASPGLRSGSQASLLSHAAGLPQYPEERLNVLLNAGFQPKKT